MIGREEFVRTIILGNSGSGKSWLAEQMSRRLAVPALDLDLIHWEPGGYNRARSPQLAAAEVRDFARGGRWIIEGVYGWLAREALPEATALVWLDIATEECLTNLKRRGARRGGDAASFAALLAWAGEYRQRDNASSAAGHQRILSEFQGPRLVLRSRSEIADLVRTLSRPSAP